MENKGEILEFAKFTFENFELWSKCAFPKALLTDTGWVLLADIISSLATTKEATPKETVQNLERILAGFKETYKAFYFQNEWEENDL